MTCYIVHSGLTFRKSTSITCSAKLFHMWNSLPGDLILIYSDSLITFKSKLTTFLFRQYFNTVYRLIVVRNLVPLKGVANGTV
jgi:hypothetical protein